MGDVNPTLWLRRRPEVPDSPEEFHRDFLVWSRAMIRQAGMNWAEFAWFAARAEALGVTNDHRCRLCGGLVLHVRRPVPGLNAAPHSRHVQVPWGGATRLRLCLSLNGRAIYHVCPGCLREGKA